MDNTVYKSVYIVYISLYIYAYGARNHGYNESDVYTYKMIATSGTNELNISTITMTQKEIFAYISMLHQ